MAEGTAHRACRRWPEAPVPYDDGRRNSACAVQQACWPWPTLLAGPSVTGAVWLSQSVRFADLIVNRGMPPRAVLLRICVGRNRYCREPPLRVVFCGIVCVPSADRGERTDGGRALQESRPDRLARARHGAKRRDRPDAAGAPPRCRRPAQRRSGDWLCLPRPRVSDRDGCSLSWHADRAGPLAAAGRHGLLGMTILLHVEDG
jgi:hypothetical protein